MSESLYQLGALADFVQLLIWTGQVAEERPASAIIVAPAGSGKTTLLENNECDQAIFTGDLTARPLAGILQGSEKVTHIMLGDFLSMFGHKESTVKLTVRLVSQMTGEKISQNPWTGSAIQPREIGLITAIPPSDFKSRQIKKHVFGGGFATRFLIIRYTYKKSTIAAIHNYIAANKYANINGNKFTIPNPGKWKIVLPEKISQAIKDFGVELKRDPLGFRAHRHLRSLVKAEARRNGMQTATRTHFERVQNYCEFFSESGKEI